MCGLSLYSNDHTPMLAQTGDEQQCHRHSRYQLQIFHMETGEDIGPALDVCSQHLQRGVMSLNEKIGGAEAQAIQVDVLPSPLEQAQAVSA